MPTTLIKKSCNTCVSNVGEHCTINKVCGPGYSQYIARDPANAVCPHTSTCYLAGQIYECYDDTFEGDDPCPKYMDKNNMPDLIKLDHYPIGAKLRVRADLTESQTYGSNSVTSAMTKLAGQVVTVKTVQQRPADALTIKEYGWGWTVSMFDGMLKEGAICN